MARPITLHDFFLSLIALFPQGMELFEEALQKWEQALNIRHHTHSTASNNSLALQGAACADLPVVIIKYYQYRQLAILLYVWNIVFDVEVGISATVPVMLLCCS